MLLNEQTLEKIINDQLENYLNDYLDKKLGDESWATRFWSLQAQAVTRRIEKHLSGTSISHEITAALINNLDMLSQHVIDHLGLNGIEDQTTQTQINMFDAATVVENKLITNSLEVLNSAEVKKNLVVTGDLVVKGDINTDSRGWQQLSESLLQKSTSEFNKNAKQVLVNEVIESIKTNGISFTDIKVDGRPLIQNSELSSAIVKSSLTEVGNLNELSVTGSAKINQTLLVQNGRIGVNTQTPSMALDIWDDDVEIVAGKISKNAGFLGTGRASELQLGVNRQKNISIDVNGLVTIDNLRVGKNKLAFAAEVPNYQGNKGDFVFNINTGPGLPFAWVCLGQFKWLSLKAQS